VSQKSRGFTGQKREVASKKPKGEKKETTSIEKKKKRLGGSKESQPEKCLRKPSQHDVTTAGVKKQTKGKESKPRT